MNTKSWDQHNNHVMGGFCSELFITSFHYALIHQSWWINYTNFMIAMNIMWFHIKYVMESSVIVISI